MKKRQVDDPDIIPIPLSDGNIFRQLFIKNPDILGDFLNSLLDLQIANIKKIEIPSSKIIFNNITKKNTDLIMAVVLNEIYHIEIEVHNNFYY